MPRVLPLLTSALLLSLLWSVASGDALAAKKSVIDARVSEALKLATQTVPEFEALRGKAEGMLVVPSVKEGGLIFAGAFGEGALIIGGETVAYYSYAKASAGFQAGFERHDMILLFLDRSALADFRQSEGWEAGIESKITLLDAGAQAGIDSSTDDRPVVGFIVGQRGLLGGISVKGGKFNQIQPD